MKICTELEFANWDIRHSKAEKLYVVYVHYYASDYDFEKDHSNPMKYRMITKTFEKVEKAIIWAQEQEKL